MEVLSLTGALFRKSQILVTQLGNSLVKKKSPGRGAGGMCRGEQARAGGRGVLTKARPFVMSLRMPISGASRCGWYPSASDMTLPTLSSV